MKTLVIDSHKGSPHTTPDNLHWKNAKMIADAVGGDLIWSYEGVNDTITGGYDNIVFVHASAYDFTDYAWLQASPEARLFYVTNEYNLGEPRKLWMAAKLGRRYSVIANHPAKASKVVQKYVKDWHILNLNALCYERHETPQRTDIPRSVVYYGSFRKDRISYYKKYLQEWGTVWVSTHAKNRDKYTTLGCEGPFVNRLKIGDGELANYGYSLYIEDVKTHTYYNYLANRFYESLSWNVLPLFDESCRRTVELSGYPDATFITHPSEIASLYDCSPTIPDSWHALANAERVATLEAIQTILLTPTH